MTSKRVLILLAILSLCLVIGISFISLNQSAVKNTENKAAATADANKPPDNNANNSNKKSADKRNLSNEKHYKTEQFFPLSDLKVGMKGYGMTTFRGTEPERFKVEILGVQDWGWTEIVVIKATGGPNDLPDMRLENTGIVAGMSGSPVYIDGKLLGAVAYGFNYKTNIGGVIPITSMVSSERSLLNSSKNRAMNNFIPLPLPLIKFEQESQTNPEHTNMNLFAKNLSSDFKPGSAISVLLISGDLTYGATGTVTFIDKNAKKVYAFGHPFFADGKTNLPFAQAEIITHVPGVVDTYKMRGHLSPILGTIVGDYSSCIVGVIDQEPEIVNYTVNLEDKNGLKKSFQYKYSDYVLQRETALFLNPLLNLENYLEKQDKYKVEYSVNISVAGKNDISVSKTITAEVWGLPTDNYTSSVVLGINKTLISDNLRPLSKSKSKVGNVSVNIKLLDTAELPNFTVLSVKSAGKNQEVICFKNIENQEKQKAILDFKKLKKSNGTIFAIVNVRLATFSEESKANDSDIFFEIYGDTPPCPGDQLPMTDEISVLLKNKKKCLGIVKINLNNLTATKNLKLPINPTNLDKNHYESILLF